MKATLSFLGFAIWASAVGCAVRGSRDEGPSAPSVDSTPQGATAEAPSAPHAPPPESASAAPPVETAAAEPPRETTPQKEPAREMPKDIEGVRRLLEETKEAAGPPSLSEALGGLPAFAESLVAALVAGDERAIDAHLLSSEELAAVFLPPFLAIVSQGDRDWLDPIRDRFRGATIRGISVVRGRHAGESVGAGSLLRPGIPSAFGRIIVVETEGGPIDLLIKQAHFVNGTWKVLRMEIVGPDERAP